MALDPTRVMLRTSSVPAVEVSVLWVQQRLNAALAPADAPRVAEDGVWGPQTETALRSFVTGVLGAPLDSTTYSAQLAPGSRTRLGMTKALESALAGAGSTVSTTPILLLGGAAILGFWFFAGSRSLSGMRGIRSRRRSLGAAVDTKLYSVVDRLTGFERRHLTKEQATRTLAAHKEQCARYGWREDAKVYYRDGTDVTRELARS